MPVPHTEIIDFIAKCGVYLPSLQIDLKPPCENCGEVRYNVHQSCSSCSTSGCDSCLIYGQESIALVLCGDCYNQRQQGARLGQRFLRWFREIFAQIVVAIGVGIFLYIAIF